MAVYANFLVLFCLFLLSDFYFQGIGRPFDYLGIFILLALYILKSNPYRMSAIFGKSFVLLSIIAPWMFLGVFFNDAVLAVGAILLGIGLIFPICYELFGNELRAVIERQVCILIAISALILFMQASIYYSTGLFVDVPGTFGSIDSRGFNEGLLYFRPSGMFQEPNAFCTAMFCMVSTCIFFKKRIVYIEMAGIFSIIFTQSLWGFGGAVILIWLLYGLRWLGIFVAGLSLLAILFSVTSGINLQDLADTSVTVSRIINIEDDPSRQARFGGADNVQFDMLFLLGHGVDSLNFQSIAANGLAFMLYSFGLIGLIAIFLYLVILSRMNIKILFIVGFLFTTFPVLSYMFFWCWLAIILALAQSEASSEQYLNLNQSGKNLNILG